MSLILLWLAGCDRDCPEWRVDADGDGFGASGVVVHSCQPVDGRVTTKGDCDDDDPAVHPGADEVCNGIDDDCDPATDEDEVAGELVWRDHDGDGYGSHRLEATHCPGDGYVSIGQDCDDRDPTVHPGAAEIACNGTDDDCDRSTSDRRHHWYDGDGDGFGNPTVERAPTCADPGPGWVENASDCDDDDPAVGEPGPVFEDLDGDGFGGSIVSYGCPSPGQVADGSDCDDGDSLVNPLRCEQCNGVDDDCNGLVDDGVTTRFWMDADGDGAGDTNAPVDACTLPPGAAERNGDCDDGDPDLHPRAHELCDGVDQDCDGQIDEELSVDFFEDLDGDGHAAVGAPLVATACARPPGAAVRRDDCDDTDPERYAGAPERCDAIDHDCDGHPTRGAVDRWYLDADGDGFGDGATAVVGCSPVGRVARGGDVDDGDPLVFPGAREVCGGPRSDGDPRTDPCAPSTCVWIREGGGTSFYDLDTAQLLGSLPCGVWTVGADGTALVASGTALMELDPTSGTCDPVGLALAPSVPGPRTQCDHYGYPEPCGYMNQEPSWDEWGCYDPGYHESCCSTAEPELVAARFDPAGDLWVSWFRSPDSGADHYASTGALVGSLSVLEYEVVDGFAFASPERTWTATWASWRAVDETLNGVGTWVAAGSLEDALDGRMVAGAADWDHVAAFVDGRDGTVLAPFRPFDARDVLAVGLDHYLAVLPDGSVVRTDGAGAVTPFLPASLAGRDLLEISPCP